MENKDPLKSFIDSNRDDFDKHIPSAAMWDAIDERLNPPKTKMVSIRTLWLVAASLLILLGLPLTWMLLTKEVVPQNQPLTAQEEKIDPMFKEFQEAETYYAAEVSEKVNLIKEMEGDEELLAEIEFLQLEYENLKKEMDAGADSQKIIAAMIENYRLRLNILEEILMELQDNRSDEKGGIYEAA
jgi:hypothetical protein